MTQRADAHRYVVARVGELAASYSPPGFHHVPDPDSGLFLCAIDHRSGYQEEHTVDGRGPYSGSALLWEVGLNSARSSSRPLSASGLRDVSATDVAEIFRVGNESAAGPELRARLWRDVAAELLREHEGSAVALVSAAGSRLGGAGGLLDRLTPMEAFTDPLAKKAFLFAKICERRGWLEVGDPEHWEVCADNVLMRLALRSGIVGPGSLDQVRRATRAAFKAVAEEAGLSPPLLDDLLWELGRDDPDLLGDSAGQPSEPGRDPDSLWY